MSVGSFVDGRREIKKITMIVSNVQNVKELKWVFCLSTSWLAVKLLGVTLQQRGGFGSSRGRSTQGKQADGAQKNPVAGRARQVVAIHSAVSVYNCPCTRKRSLEAGGRYSGWSLKPGFTLPFVTCIFTCTCFDKALSMLVSSTA